MSLNAGADPHDVLLVARAAAYEAVVAAVCILDEGGDPNARESDPGWHLVETDADCNPTGREIGGLHESLLETDPSGHEGADLWE
ncbi:hypothetical protein [Micromonospora luteifusca]|uniref:hypothetical protein n=1 Tax=Micromonospora luteifusca TaxID=709860 RepID=UPI0033BC2317